MHDDLLAASAYLAGLPAAEREAGLKQMQAAAALSADPADLLVAPPIQTLAEYMQVDLPRPGILVDPPLVVRDEVTVTIGASGKGKTTMNIHRMLRWSAGLPMFDKLPDLMVPVEGKPIRVLVIENEGSAAFFQDKMRRMLDPDNGFLTLDQVKTSGEHLLIWANGGYSDFKIDNDKDKDVLRRGIEEHRPDIVFLEPFQGLHSADENDNSRIADVMGVFQSLATLYECAIVVAHHERKGGVGEGGESMDLGRGASAINGAAAVIENFRSVRGGKFRELSWSKARYGGAERAGTMRMDYNEHGWYELVPEDEIEEEIMAVLRGAPKPVTADGVCSNIGEPGGKQSAGFQSVVKTLQNMRDKGRLAAESTGNSTGYTVIESTGGLSHG